MHAWDRILDESEPHGHYCQFYKADEPLLNRNVGHFLWEGFLRGDGLIVIAAPQRHESLTGHLTRLGVDVRAALRERQLVILDAQETLACFMIDGEPDAELFESTIGAALKLTGRNGPESGVRAYGEMVGLLWQAGQFEAAIRLEELWNKLLQSSGITLFCGYPIDVFGKEIGSHHLDAVMRAHPDRSGGKRRQHR